MILHSVTDNITKNYGRALKPDMLFRVVNCLWRLLNVTTISTPLQGHFNLTGSHWARLVTNKITYLFIASVKK